MLIQLCQSDANDPSQKRIAQLFNGAAFPAEKKPFLADLARSSGPYLAVLGQDLALIDAASQIATFGLGWNHSALFGAAQHLSTWVDDGGSQNARAIADAFADLLRRKLGSLDHHVGFCASGAEAIELALAACFEHRSIASADRVLAFRGAFHGRTKFALEATWSPEKREPFSWPDHAAVFAPYPELNGSDPTSEPVAPGWCELWSESNDDLFAEKLRSHAATTSAHLATEIESLLGVRKAIRSRRVFAILVEPMQSEGGDRYSSGRFHQGLATLARTNAIPLIYDEIQTGLHLGNRFFWHQQFELHDAGRTWVPDLVVCAKKAQVGVVISRLPLEHWPSPCHASLARGYIQASMLDQYGDAISQIDSLVRDRLATLVNAHASLIGRPRHQGLAFAFDFVDAATAKRAIAIRFRHGLIFYPAGERTVRFRLNLAFDKTAIDELFSQLDRLLSALVDSSINSMPPTVELPPTERHYEFHRRLIGHKLSAMRGDLGIDGRAVVDGLRDQIRSAGLSDPELDVQLLDRNSYPQYRDKILQIQVEAYEPARQTPGEDFDRVFASERPLAIVVERRGAIVGMAFAGPLAKFTKVHGVATDPLRNRDDAAYMVDVTVAEPYRGGLGRLLKQAIVLLAAAKGYRTIHGRNRDHLARGMWAINLSLGSYVTKHLPNDYNDLDTHRDCLYYQCAVRWDLPSISLSNGVDAPFGLLNLAEGFVAKNLAKAINKPTLSNFVDGDFIDDLQAVLALFPSDLRHGYTASGLSEAVDKVVKVLWRTRTPRRKLLAFRGHFFGEGTMLARSLSGIGTARFEVQRLPPPTHKDDRAFDELDRALESDEVLATFVEPLPSRTMTPIASDVLRAIRERCSAKNVPLIYNESAAMFYRYSAESFTASGIFGLVPDGIVVSLGGQMALTLLRPALFSNEPLQLISTWDGDVFSLAKFAEAARVVQQDPASFRTLQERFVAALERRLATFQGVRCRLKRGCGAIEGPLPADLEGMIRRGLEGDALICPSHSAMQQFVDRHSGQ